MTTDLDALEALCRAATPGPWRDEGNGIGMEPGRPPWHVVVVGLEEHGSGYMRYDALTLSAEDRAFIAAANPAAILELVERVRALQAQRDDSEHTLASCMATYTAVETALEGVCIDCQHEDFDGCIGALVERARRAEAELAAIDRIFVAKEKP